MSTPDCVILFSYHKDCPVTRRHYDLFVALNPYFPVIPLVCGDPPAIPGTVDVAALPNHWDTSNNWVSCDTRLYRWFDARPFDARRYVLAEWDVYCTQGVEAFYRSRGVWDSEMAVADANQYDPNSGWVWWPEAERLPCHFRPHAAMVAPCAMSIFSHASLARVVEAARSVVSCFCEVRLGTAARTAGVCPIKYGLETIHANTFRPPVPTPPGIYHPVKEAFP